MKALVSLFKALKNTTEDVARRALPEQLSAAVIVVIDLVTPLPAWQNTKGTKEVRFSDVAFKSGAELLIQAGECWLSLKSEC